MKNLTRKISNFNMRIYSLKRVSIFFEKQNSYDLICVAGGAETRRRGTTA